MTSGRKRVAGVFLFIIIFIFLEGVGSGMRGAFEEEDEDLWAAARSFRLMKRKMKMMRKTVGVLSWALLRAFQSAMGGVMC